MTAFLGRTSDEVDALMGRGKKCLNENNNKEAKNHFTTVIRFKNTPNDRMGKAYLFRSVANRRLNYRNEALSDLYSSRNYLKPGEEYFDSFCALLLAEGKFSAAANFAHMGNLSPKLKTALKCHEDACRNYFEGNYYETFVQMQRLEHFAPTNTVLQSIISECLMEMGERSLAKNIAEKIIAKNDGSVMCALYVRGMCLYDDGDDKSAERDFSNALKFDMDPSIFEELEKMQHLTVFKKIRSSYADSNGQSRPFLVHYKKGLKYLENGNNESALNEFIVAMNELDADKYPKKAALCFLKQSQALYAANNCKEALIKLRQSMDYAKDGSHFELYLRCQIKQCDLDGCKYTIKWAGDEGFEIANESYTALCNTVKSAKEHFKSKNYEAAYYHLENIVNSSVTNMPLGDMMLECCFLLDKYSQMEVISSWLMTNDTDNSSASKFYYGGITLFRKNKLDEALASFKNAVKLNHVLAKNMCATTRKLLQAKTLVANNKISEAEQLLESMKTNKDARIDVIADALVHCLQGWVQSLLSKFDEAIRSFQEALNRDPDLYEVFYCRGECYIKMLHYQAAVNDLERYCARYSTPKAIDTLKIAQAELNKTNNHYAILEVSQTANTRTIERAYRRLAKIHHPDRHHIPASRNIHQEIMKKLTIARTILLDKTSRSEYDQKLRGFD